MKIPDWFSPYSRPYPPRKPKKEKEETQVLGELVIESNSYIEISSIPEGTTRIVTKGYIWDGEYNPGGIESQFARKVVLGNSQYNEQLKRYEEEYIEYKKKIKEWNEIMVFYQKEKAVKLTKREWKLYQKLKTKFESPNSKNEEVV